MLMNFTQLQKELKNVNNENYDVEMKKLQEKLPVTITFQGEIVFKVVPKSWHNPAFPVH